MSATKTERLRRMRPLAWSAAAGLIFLPLLTMKLVDPQAWELEDLPFAFIMVAAVGVAFELGLRAPAGWTYRAGAGVAVATASMIIWANLAVGFVGSENNPLNMVFFVVPAIALAGGAISRFRPLGLAIAMAGAAGGQLTAGIIVFYHGFFSGPLTIAFTGLWLAASLLFLRSSWKRTSSKGGFPRDPV